MILIPSQWELFIGTLILKPMGVIHWYSDAQSREYSVTIVIRLLRIWITIEYLNYFWVLKTTYVILEMFEYLNYIFWVIKTTYKFLELIVSYSFDIWKTDYFLNHLWYIWKIKVCDLFATYYFRLWNFFSYFWKPIAYYNFWRLILHLITL